MFKSELNCRNADLCICLGSTLQILPVGEYPLLTKKNNGKIVIVNLQETRINDHADLIINNKLDIVFQILLEKLKITNSKLNGIEIRVDTLNDDLKYHLNVRGMSVDQSYSEQSQIMKREPNEEPVLKKVKIEEKLEWKPDLIILISGKRKSGKTFLSEKLFSHLLDTEFNLNEIILAGPLKEIYAKENGLDYERLLDTSSYKELHRVDMIKWSDSKRVEDLYFFCKIAVGKVAYDLSMKVKNKLNIWVVTDLRLQVELQYFKLKYSNLIKTVRVLASDEVRIQRNWVFTKGLFFLKFA